MDVSYYVAESWNVSSVKNTVIKLRGSGPQEHPVSFMNESCDLEQEISFL